MPKLLDVEKDELKSFLDYLIENGTEGTATDTDEERAELAHKLMDKLDETSTVTLGRAAAFLGGAADTLAIMYDYRSKQEAN